LLLAKAEDQHYQDGAGQKNSQIRQTAISLLSAMVVRW